MRLEEFQKLVKKDKYQVFVFTCPAHFPFVFARHPWLVVNKKGTLSRWEVLFRKNLLEQKCNHVHINFLPPWRGIEIFPFVRTFNGKSKLLKIIEGDENSPVRKLIDFIENSKENYPHYSKYFLMGPNSNTYVKWILNNFPEIEVKLPWNAVGKGYKIN